MSCRDFAQYFGVTFSNLQERLDSSARQSTSLFPLFRRAFGNAEQGGKLRLRET